MRRSNAATLFYLLLVFVSGALVGGFANRLYMMKTVNARVDVRKVYREEMRTRLHLTDPQVAQLETIMADTRQRFHDSHKEVENEHVAKVQAMLNDSQKAEYAKMRAEREKRRQQHPDPKGP